MKPSPKLPVRYTSPLVSWDHERRFRDLAASLFFADAIKRPPSLRDAFLFVKQGTKEAPANEDQAIDARCIYCHKTIKSWNAATKGKKQKRRISQYDALSELAKSHSYACAEEWAWELFSRHALEQTIEREDEKIKAWLDKIVKTLAEYQRIGNKPETHADMRGLLDIIAMFERLPVRVPAVVQSIELFVAGVGYEAKQDTWPEKIVKHGTTEATAHVYLPCKFGDAAFGVWGMCPCGEFEWRGPEMPIHDRALQKLIGWYEGKHKHVLAKVVGHDQSPIRVVEGVYVKAQLP